MQGCSGRKADGIGETGPGGKRTGLSRALFTVGLSLLLLAAGWAAAIPRAPGNVDLSVSEGDIRLEPAGGGTPYVNDVIYINATIYNGGDEPAFNVSVIYSYNTTDMPLFQFGRLELNSTGTVIEPYGGSALASFAWDTSGLELEPYINYSVFVEVRNDTQPDNQSDADPQNNLASVNITFEPDVVPFMVDLTSSADNAVVGETISFMATLGNSGIRPAVDEPVAFYLDDAAEPFYSVELEIPTEGVARAPCSWNTTGASDGAHNITAWVRETSKTVSVSLKYRVDPYIKTITSSSYSARVGDVLSIDATVDNNGVETALLVLVDFFLDARGPELPLGHDGNTDGQPLDQGAGGEQRPGA